MSKRNTKKVTEWYLDTPWGKVALISWGEPSMPPVLLLHGYMDNAGTYVTLIDNLPDTHYYVAFDIPGHGKSDPFPLGPLMSVGHAVAAMREVVQHLAWRRFSFVGHSMGYIVGVLYNRVFPHEMTRIVGLDPKPPIANHYFSDHLALWYYRYPTYYDDLNDPSTTAAKLYPRSATLQHVMTSRALTAAQARPVVDRALVPAENGLYRLSFEKNAKLITNIPLSFSTFLDVLTKHFVPTLMIHGTKSKIMYEVTKEPTEIFMEKLRASVRNLTEVSVAGGHDIHMTNAPECAKSIVEFLEKDISNKKCKL